MRIGLALSGGAARGIAHVGVLNYLDERGVKPCCLAGTSAGSIIGALYCSGRSTDEIKKIATEMSWRNIIKLTIPRTGLVDSSRLLEMLHEYLGQITFEELEIPLVVNAVDLLSGKQIIIEEGPVAEAVQASCSIPGIFTPVKWKNYLLVDGGLLDNLPAVFIKDKNIDYLISVDVGAQSALEKEPGNIFDVLIQSFDIMRRHRDIPAYEYTDKLIEPDLGDIGFFDTSKAELIIERGYEAARKALDRVKLEKKKSLLSKWLDKR